MTAPRKHAVCRPGQTESATKGKPPMKRIAIIAISAIVLSTGGFWLHGSLHPNKCETIDCRVACTMTRSAKATVGFISPVFTAPLYGIALLGGSGVMLSLVATDALRRRRRSDSSSS